MRLCLSLALSLILLTAASGRARRSSKAGQPGNFDYYILALSWAPDFCARPDVHPDPRECGPGRRLGFIVHGLWPQQDDGGHPSQCAPARPVARDIVQRALNYIPGEGLIQHEWRDHGTCSGLSAAAYFDTVRRAWESIVVPPEFRQPDRPADLSPHDIEARFIAANPNLRNSLRVACSGGQLSEVRICLARDLSPHPCSSRDTECPSGRIGMLPVR